VVLTENYDGGEGVVVHEVEVVGLNPVDPGHEILVEVV